MIRRFFILLAISTIALSSCVKNPDPVKPDPDLDLTFAFGTRQNVSLTVSATDVIGNPSEGILFSVYTEEPYSEEGKRLESISPIYKGYTEKGGSITLALPVPTDATDLFIIPEYAGYGKMVTVEKEASMSVELVGKQSTKAVSTKADGFTPRERIDCGNTRRFYTYFQSDVDYTPDYGEFIVGSELVSSESLSTDFLDMVNEWFPEGGNNFDITKCTDIKIESDGTEVWVTYLGDGGYTSGSGTKDFLNSLLYFSYNESNIPVKNFQKDFGLTYAIIDGNPSHIATGTKVQLLYWDAQSQRYYKEFPAGTNIGFVFLRDGYRKNDANKTRTFSMNDSWARFSTAQMNSNKYAYAVTIWNEQFECYIMGNEYGGEKGTLEFDSDFNDLLSKITTSKPVSLVSTQTAPVSEDEEEGSCYEGTLAYEDLWPLSGDYDFNDFVTSYKYTLMKSRRTNDISSIVLNFTPKAIGASNDNGFGIQLPIPYSSIKGISGVEAEDDGQFVTIRVYQNVRQAFDYAKGFINTNTSNPHMESHPSVITINLSQPISESNISFTKFNPFIFSSYNIGKEIHLVDYAPTSAADFSLFGTGVDKSDLSGGIYYRMDNSFPWALDIAKSGLSTWRYPLEQTMITDAYLHYATWVLDHKTAWFDWTVPGNVDESKLYPFYE